MKVLRPVILKAFEKQIKDSFEKLDSMAYAIYKEAEKAKKDAKNDPENIPNIYQRYAQAAQREALKRREQAQKATQDKKVNVATTKEESMFKHITFPGGISTKAAEYKEKARQGNGWENELFGLGKAKPTGTFKAKEITRKSPHRVRATVNDRQPGGVRASVDSGYQGNQNEYSGQYAQKMMPDKYYSKPNTLPDNVQLNTAETAPNVF